MKLLIAVDTRREAKALAPWACAIVKVDGGYMAFEFANDLKIWKQQR